jgi:hypothetical protein
MPAQTFHSSIKQRTQKVQKPDFSDVQKPDFSDRKKECVNLIIGGHSSEIPSGFSLKQNESRHGWHAPRILFTHV